MRILGVEITDTLIQEEQDRIAEQQALVLKRRKRATDTGAFTYNENFNGPSVSCLLTSGVKAPSLIIVYYSQYYRLL